MRESSVVVRSVKGASIVLTVLRLSMPMYHG
jgi:hypothetical protein